MNRYDAVAKIEGLVIEAQAKLKQAYLLADEWGIPFEHDLTAKVDEAPRWEPSENYWESSSC